MANKPLRSIKFPGLSDTYTVPEVDSTLTGSGKAADAKATGDQISDLKSAVTISYAPQSGTIIEWERGAIASADGTEPSQADWTRIRTDGYAPKAVKAIKPESGYKVIIAAYENSTYKGMWDGTILKNSGTWFERYVDLSPIINYDLRFVFANTNSTTINVDAASNLNLYCDVDFSLSQPGKAADAKKVADAILNAENTVIGQSLTAKTVLTNADDCDALTPGMYRYGTGNVPDNAPADAGGMIIVFAQNPETIANNVQLYISGSCNVKCRFKVTAGWTDWKTVITENDRPLLNAAEGLDSQDDLNDLNIGIYSFSSVSKPDHYPANDNCVVICASGSAQYHTCQICVTASGNMYTRYKSVSTWTDWAQIISRASAYAVKTEGFAAESYTGRNVVLSWDSLTVFFTDGTKFTDSGSVYTMNDFDCILCVRNNTLTVLHDYAAVRAGDAVLFEYSSGNVVGGLLLPDYNKYMALESFDDDARLNVYKKVRQLGLVKWTPKADVVSGEGTNTANVEVTGIPYSSVKEYCKFVGIDVSLHTFMTAVNDIHSLLYTEKISASASQSAYERTYHGVNCSSYYGTVCSGLVSYALGTPYNYSSWEFRTDIKNSKALDNQDVENLLVGDILVKDGHCAVVSKLNRYENGSIKSIEVSEHLAPIKIDTYSVRAIRDWSKVIDRRFCRYDPIYKNTKYTASPFVKIGNETLYKQGDFVYVDETNGRKFYRCITANSDSEFNSNKWRLIPAYVGSATYSYDAVEWYQYGEDIYKCIETHTAGNSFDPTKWERVPNVFEWASYPYVYNDDIVTFAGDRACFKTNDLIYINFVKGAYTHMQIYKDGTLVQTLSLPSSGYQIDVSSYCTGYGKYKARLTDGTNFSRYTYFEVVDTRATVQYSNDKVSVSFSSANGRPVEVQIVEVSGFPVCHKRLTDADIANGSVVFTPKAKTYAERFWDFDKKYTNYDETVYARVVFAGEYGNAVSSMTELGALIPVKGELIYPENTTYLGEVSNEIYAILADDLANHTYTFGFKAGSGGDVDVLASVGTIQWKNSRPESFTQGKYYQYRIENGVATIVEV